MAGNGFPRVLRRDHRGSRAGNGRKWLKMAENGRKWQKKVHRGYLVGNGFSRVSRHSPTTLVCRFWDTIHQDSLFKNFLKVLSTLDMWSALKTHTW